MSNIIRIAKPLISDEEKKAVLEVLDSGYYVQGEKVQKFEEEFSKYIGTRYAIAVSSGTAALHLALLALGIKNSDEIIAPSFSFISTTNCILYCGGKPVFGDIDLKSFNIDTKSVGKLTTKNTKAIIPVHLYGNPVKLEELINIAKDSNISIVEDCAQSIGASLNGKRVGSFGDFGCFSFYPTKGITTLEGGMVTTNNEEFAEKIRVLRNIGQKEKYVHTDLGFNYRMNEVEAAIGSIQLNKLDEWIKKRIENAKFLTENLKDVKGIVTPSTEGNNLHVFSNYTIRVTEEFSLTRDEFSKIMKDNGIEVMSYYITPIHKQPLYKDFNNLNLPHTEEASKTVVSLPVHPGLTQNDLEKIVSTVENLN